MQVYGVCKKCGSSMAVLDIMMEGYELVCMRCGIREVTHHTMSEPPPCYQ